MGCRIFFTKACPPFGRVPTGSSVGAIHFFFPPNFSAPLFGAIPLSLLPELAAFVIKRRNNDLFCVLYIWATCGQRFPLRHSPPNVRCSEKGGSHDPFTWFPHVSVVFHTYSPPFCNCRSFTAIVYTSKFCATVLFVIFHVSLLRPCGVSCTQLPSRRSR